jgi:hypothetical protein
MTSFLGTSIKAFPSHLWRLLIPPTKILILKPLWALPNIFCEVWVICDKSKLRVRDSSLWVIWVLEHLSFVKQSSWYLLLLEVKPPRRLGIALELPRLWWTMRKFVKVRFASARKEVRASKVRKVVERDPAWSWLLVGNSSNLNGDIGITCVDSEFW